MEDHDAASTAQPLDIVADRPLMPGYGIVDADAGRGLLPWRWALERLSTSHAYWLATASATGEPHLAAVWAVWFDDALWFSTGGRSRKAADLAANPECSISAADTDESVVLCGSARRTGDPAVIDAVEHAYTAKYGSGFPDPRDNPLYRVDARTVIGVIEREEEFAERATRWTITR